MAAVFTAQTQQEMSTNMKDLVTCIICKSSEISSTLKMLPCFYSACTDCLQSHLQDVNKGDHFECPGCSKYHGMPDGGHPGFDDNFLSTKMKFLSNVLGNNPPKCWACEAVDEEKPSATYCLTCQHHFCKSDGKKHMKTSGHEVISHDELSTDGALVKLLSSHNSKCEDTEIHREPRLLEHYCVTCQTLCCSHCLTYKHEGHEKMPVKKAAEKFGEELKNKLAEVKKNKVMKDKCLKSIETNHAKMKQNKNTTAQEITSFGEEVKNMVDKLVKEKLENLEIDANKEEDDFKEAIDKVTSDKNTLKMAEQHMDVFLEHSSYINILHKYDVFKKNLVTCRENVKDTKMVEAKDFPFHHETRFEIERSLAKMFHGKELQETDTIVSQKIETFKAIAVDHDNNDVIAVGGHSVKILGMDGNEKGQIQCQGLDNAGAVAVHDHVIYIIDEKRREVVVFDRNGNRKKCINFPAKTSDKNDYFSIAVNPVNGDLYLSSRDTQSVYKCSTTGTQVQPFITEGLDNPRHLCVIPNKGLVFSNRFSDEIHMYNFDGTLLWKYGSEGEGDEQFQYPTGVCTDHLDNIFAADELNERIHYISTKGTLIRHIELEICPWSLSFINDSLIVISDEGELEIIKCNYT